MSPLCPLCRRILTKINTLVLKQDFNICRCQGEGGLLCSDNGICSDGICYCYPGHGGTLCELDDNTVLVDEFSTSTTTGSPLGVKFKPSTTTVASLDVDSTQCPILNGQVCNEHGRCVNGFCVCDVNWGGEACGVTRRSGFCNAYRRCAECTAFGIKCATNCNTTAIFQLVENLPSSASDYIFHRCRYRSSLHQCSFFYQLGKETVSGKKVILVKSCPDWLISLRGIGIETTERPNVTGLATGLTWSVIVPINITSPGIKPVNTEQENDAKGQTDKDDLPSSVHNMTIGLWYTFLWFVLASLVL